LFILFGRLWGLEEHVRQKYQEHDEARKAKVDELLLNQRTNKYICINKERWFKNG
jgi:hypothetical protein